MFYFTCNHGLKAGVTAKYYLPDWSYLLGKNWLAQNYLPGIYRLAKIRMNFDLRRSRVFRRDCGLFSLNKLQYRNYSKNLTINLEYS